MLDTDYDPVTQKKDVLCLESFTSLANIEVMNNGESTDREEDDLRTLRAVLKSWHPGLASRHFHLHFMATARSAQSLSIREKAECLSLVERIAQVVEEECSGTCVRSVLISIQVIHMLLSQLTGLPHTTITVELDHLPTSAEDPKRWQQLVAEVQACFPTASQEKRLTVEAGQHPLTSFLKPCHASD